MRHVTLACKNHLQLRWTCKSVAYTPGEGYNGSRNIFFQYTGDRDKPSDAPAHECSCSARELILAPEDPWAGLSLEEQRKAIAED